jgi:L-rhamnose isomerase
MALDAITNAVPQEMVVSLAVKETATEAWEAVKSMRIDSDAVWTAKAQRLRLEFEGIRFKEGESIDDFTMSQRRRRRSIWCHHSKSISMSTRLRRSLVRATTTTTALKGGTVTPRCQTT